MEEKPAIKQIQSLEQLAKQAQQLGYQELKKLEGKKILFEVNDNTVVGTLKDVGDNYLLLEDIRILDSRMNIENYLNKTYYVETKTLAERKLAFYNKRDISQLYPFDE